MKKLKSCILSQIDIDAHSLDNILAKFKSLHLAKGEYFVKEGKVCRQMAFIELGYMRMYDIVDGKEITLWIGSAGSFITSLSSFVFETVNNWNIQAISDCKLYVINRSDHFMLNKTEVRWLEFDNLLLANSYALLERRMFSQLHTTAKERFLSLMEDEPNLFNNVPLQYIASMIGIAPESLSRLRKMK